MAYAQTLTVPNNMDQPVHLLTVALTTQSGQLRASQLIGSTVYDVQNRNIGSVKDIVFGHDGTVEAVVVDVGAFLGVGGKYVAVSLEDLKTDNNRLTLNRSKEQLQGARSYQLDRQQ
ncbi:MAG TPA: PRC-barrel domain-containing protein [Stellaceae bacterium]|nr:PRC-barrel domain-containing protein [Stellaceae bacterium]